MRIKNLLFAGIAILAIAVVSGCGDSDDKGEKAATPAPTTTKTTTQPPAASRAVTVHMTEFAFDPKDAVAKEGKVTISAPNDGKVIHELVVIKTDQDPAQLPKKGGKVDESTAVGEIADVEPGATKKGTFQLSPGKYAMICALPGHYEGGMFGSLTVE